MKVYNFFKTLNEKIKKYERAIDNDRIYQKKPITIVWVENDAPKNN